MRLLVLQNLGVFLDGSPTIEDGGLDKRDVLAETSVFVLNLEGQLPGMAHDYHGRFSSDRLDRLKRGKDEDGRLSETRLGLTEDIGTENGLRDGKLLDCRRKPSSIVRFRSNLNNRMTSNI